MTDEQMDARLQAAGETWRAATDAAPEPAIAGTATHDVETLDIHPHRRRHVGLLASAAVVAAALVTGGAFLLGHGGGKQRPGADAAGLEGTVWRLVAVGAQPEQANSLATMYIDKDGNVVADDTCTLVGAHLDVRDGHLYPTGNFDIRYHDCTDSVGELTFTDAFGLLTDFPSYVVSGNGLTLAAAGQPTMRFTAAPELVPPTTDVPTFLGATWRLTKVVDGNQVEYPVTGAPTLRVRNGQLVASDGCNTINASASVTGQQVDLKNITTSAVGCIGSTGATAAAVDAFFTTDGLHEQIDGTTLTIKGGGVGYLTYQWQPDDTKATDPSALTDKAWVLTSIAGRPARALASLYIASAGPVRGTDGCADPLHANATVGQGTITASGVPKEPAQGCIYADQATTIDSFLNQKPALWSVRDGKLLIYGGGAQAFALVYETGTPPPAFPSTAPDPSQLTGKTWRFTGVEVHSAGSSTGRSAAESAVLTFDRAGGFRLAVRCGEYTGPAVVRKATMGFPNHRFETHSCPAPAVDQRTAIEADDAALAAVLAGPTSWAFDNGKLLLTKGDTTLTFDP